MTTDYYIGFVVGIVFVLAAFGVGLILALPHVRRLDERAARDSAQ